MFVEILQTFDLELKDAQMILVGIALFWIYYKVTSTLLFTPLLRLVEAREAATEGAQEGASRLEAEAARVEQEYEESLLEGRQAAVTAKLAALAKVSKEASTIVADAEAAGNRLLESERESLTQLEERLRSELESDVESLAEGLVGKLLSGGTVSPEASSSQ